MPGADLRSMAPQYAPPRNAEDGDNGGGGCSVLLVLCSLMSDFFFFFFFVFFSSFSVCPDSAVEPSSRVFFFCESSFVGGWQW